MQVKYLHRETQWNDLLPGTFISIPVFLLTLTHLQDKQLKRLISDQGLWAMVLKSTDQPEDGGIKDQIN